MKKTSLGLMIGLFAISAHANETTLLPDLKLELGPVLREDQKILDVNKYEAEIACCTKNKGFKDSDLCYHLTSQQQAQLLVRLPSIRELAIFAQSRGAKGISEKKKDGYDLVKGRDNAGKPDHFYFSSEGYKGRSGPAAKRWLWSSSPAFLDNNTFYVLDDMGNITVDDPDDGVYTNAASCVQPR